MRILQLFINNNLEEPINWNLSEDNKTESGTSTWSEISMFNDIQVEVYLNANCCSILKTDVTGISTKRLTEELILGILEESIVDDIEEIKPIILRTETDIAYIAIFNKVFYENLISKLDELGKPIRFVQSFAFSTKFNVDCWTVFLNKEQSFIRTSKYEYFLLDNATPIPEILIDMAKTEKPKSILIY